MSDATARAMPRDHIVQFYQHDEELVATVSEFAIGALWSDGAVILVATTFHLFALEVALLRRGVDVGAARLDGSLVMVDADQALARFLIGGKPDFEAFANEVGDMIRTYAAAGRRVKVFGEMVALLWNAGHVAVAIELEKMWNDFGREVSFSLMCAYPASSVTGDGTEDAFLQVCHCHSAVIGDGEDHWDQTNRFVVHRAPQTRSFIGHSSAIGPARRFVADTLSSWRLDKLIDDCLMVVSELVTNAVIHAESDFTVSLSSHGDAVRLSVHDHSPVVPVMRSPVPAAVSGRGLRMVTALTRRWGTDFVDDGKIVWAELCG